MYDYLIVGSGFFGSICAQELTKICKKVLVIDKRDHIGGNCYTENRDGINLHMYGAHIFHTSNNEVWRYINKFATFNNYRHQVVANYRDEIFSLPFNMWTFNKLWGVKSPMDAIKKIKEQSMNIKEPKNLEEQAIKLVGTDVYNKLIKGYTYKQWMRDPKELPKEIIKRLPVRFTYDNNYFNELHQGIPVGGYTPIFKKLLEGCDVQLNTDYFKSELPPHDKVIFTGPIDKFFNYSYGHLEYKTVHLKHIRRGTKNYQGNSVVNYTDYLVPYTRILEHKHFEFGAQDVTWISHEYPTPYVPDKTEPYYPVNDKINNEIYRKYKHEADKINDKVLFGGRLAEYKYYDMHQVIESALNFIKKEKSK